MDRAHDTTNGDYAAPAGSGVAHLVPVIYRCLQTPLGSYWADTKLGSRLHELKREKDVARIGLLAMQYARAALSRLLNDGRAKSIDVAYQRPKDGTLTLHIDVVDAGGNQQRYLHLVQL